MRIAVFAVLIVTVAALPAKGAQQDESRWIELREALFGDQPIHDGSELMVLDAPTRAHDAAVVPLHLEPAFFQTPERYIKTVTLVVDENPLPMAGKFHFTPASGKAAISTRVRINAYTHVRAIVETSDGDLHMVKRFVKASGGCSAPAGKDPEAALANLGRLKLRRPEAVVWGQPNAAQILVSHPNHTGMQMDQVTFHYTPAYFVETIDVRFRGESVLTVESNFSLSENPSIRFHYLPQEPGELSVRVTDSKGDEFARVWTVSNATAEANAARSAQASAAAIAH